MNPILDFSHLTISERIQLVEDLWDSVSDAPEVLELSPSQRVELDRRLAAHRQDPDRAIPWTELRRELFEGR